LVGDGLPCLGKWGSLRLPYTQPYFHHGRFLRREYYRCVLEWSSSPVVDLTSELSVSELSVVPFEYTTEDQRFELLSSALAFCKFLKPRLVTWDRDRHADDIVPLPKDAVPVASVDQSLYLEAHPPDESAFLWVTPLPYATGELNLGSSGFSLCCRRANGIGPLT
jgi:hypothetical protein